MISPTDRKGKREGLKEKEGEELTELIGKLTETCQQLYNNALNAMKTKAYLTALSHLEQGLNINPQDGDLLLLAGLCHYALGNLTEAHQCWKDLHVPLAERYLEQSEAEQERFPRVARAYNLGLKLMKKGERHLAIRRLERALRQGPQLLPALELLAWAYYSGKKYHKCRKTLLRIGDISTDAPVLGKLGPEMMRMARWEHFPYIIAIVILLGGMFGFAKLRVKPETAPLPVPVRSLPAPEQSQPSPADTDLLRKTANTLVEQGNYLAGADIFYSLDGKGKPESEISPPEQLAWSKAAAHYYFLAMRRFRTHDDMQADGYFTRSRAYPVHSYVYDDSLYYQALIKERLGQYPSAALLFKELLREAPESGYASSAVNRWGKLAAAQAALRREFLDCMAGYPEYRTMVQNIAERWKD
jgi:tetratricopeptide (TPR) repeat protein